LFPQSRRGLFGRHFRQSLLQIISQEFCFNRCLLLKISEPVLSHKCDKRIAAALRNIDSIIVDTIIAETNSLPLIQGGINPRQMTAANF